MTRLRLDMQAQPDDRTCGPTCLHAVYRFHGDEVALDEVIRECSALEEGGTLGVFLALHALRRGYRATIYTYNLHVFDPTWFPGGGSKRRRRRAERGASAAALEEKLRAQMEAKEDPKLRTASRAYVEFLRAGGEIFFEDLTPGLVRRPLSRGFPILTGLSATYLYRSEREIHEDDEPDDVGGEPVGHFVVLCGYDRGKRTVRVADPYAPNPYSSDHFYDVSIDRVVGAVLLGIVTYDSNLVVLRPPGSS